MENIMEKTTDTDEALEKPVVEMEDFNDEDEACDTFWFWEPTER